MTIWLQMIAIRSGNSYNRHQKTMRNTGGYGHEADDGGADEGAGQRRGAGAGYPVLQQLRAEGHGVRRPGDRQIVCGDAKEQ